MKTNVLGNVITFTFDGLSDVVFDATLADAHHAQRAKMHGYEQKIRDSAAIARKQKDGAVITVTEEMRRNEVVAMVAHLSTSPDWNAKARAVESPVIRRIADTLGCTYAEAEAKVAEKMLAELSGS